MPDSAISSNVPQAEVDKLIELFRQCHFAETVSLGTNLVRQFPGALILYEILGAAFMSLNIFDETIKNYQNILAQKMAGLVN